ncbi:MAG: hypothetical protein KDA60_12220 [Planctomycetales bacterium]|nr:hypothetical protein [Planctomycetales bacterium]
MLHLSGGSFRRAWLAMWMGVSVCASAHGAIETIDLLYEFDGDLAVQSYGTVVIADNALGGVDFTITANLSRLGSSADIHKLFFNVPSSLESVLPNTWLITNEGGTSNKTIEDFEIVGPDPSITGGAGASFDWGIDFGDGAGKPGNGKLSEARFTLNNLTQTLTVSDLLSGGLSDPNGSVPPVLMAVHFQGTDTREGSETIGGNPTGGGPPVVPEPQSIVVWLLVAASGLGACWTRKRTAVH